MTDLVRALKKLVPVSVKQRIKKVLGDRRRNRLFGELAPLVPPPDLMFDGPRSYGEFKSNGEEFLRIYREVCGLRPDERMLDVGSGIGRKTLPLTQYFTPSARYEGIDITRAGVEWCSSRITPRYPNFRFQWIDVYNGYYNPEGGKQASEYRFPFEDVAFDFVMLGSVFTHMLPSDVEHYLSEVRRVMDRGARCLISYFLLNEESSRLVAAGKSRLSLGGRLGECLVASREQPEEVIAYPESWVRERYRRAGLEIRRLEYGSWSGRERCLSYQDLVLAVKK